MCVWNAKGEFAHLNGEYFWPSGEYQNLKNYYVKNSLCSDPQIYLQASYAGVNTLYWVIYDALDWDGYQNRAPYV